MEGILSKGKKGTSRPSSAQKRQNRTNGFDGRVNAFDVPIKEFYARFWHLIRTTCLSYDNGRVLVLGAIYFDRALLQVIANMTMTGRIARRKIAAKALLATVVVLKAVRSYLSVRAIYAEFETEQQNYARHLARELEPPTSNTCWR